MLRIGCVPYLNAKPLIDWFHSADCDVAAKVEYAVPSELACRLREGTLDAGLLSIFELFRSPNLAVVPDISISADGPVRSVRLFSRVPYRQIRSVALDTSSLTSTALIRILLKERYGIQPEYSPRPPDLGKMLASNDAGLIIGDLRLFESPAAYVMDLGQEWKELTELPFCYAAWLARREALSDALVAALTRAREWGEQRLEPLAVTWADRLNLPLDRVRDYFLNVMQYDLDERKQQANQAFHARCIAHGLI